MSRAVSSVRGVLTMALALADRQVDGLFVLRRVTPERSQAGAVNGVNVSATIEQQRHHVRRSADDRTVQRMTASAVDVVNERWLLIEEATYARQLAHFGGGMDRMILGHGRGHEPTRRINHARGYDLPDALTRPPFVRVRSTVRFPSAFGHILVRKLLAGCDGKVVSHEGTSSSMFPKPAHPRPLNSSERP